jgi:peptidoglycan/LPS O-acetylase OafA/YrhL
VTSPADPGQRRPHLTSLDGLRGIAALVVVVFHALIISPAWQSARLEGVEDRRDPLWVLTHTPLALSWMGNEAVFVFFILSAFVLSLPAAAGHVTWRAYYPKRLVRIYLPVWASLVLAVAWAVVVPRRPDPGRSEWFNNHFPVQGALDVARDALLLPSVGWINSPLWSLTWEMIFSLLLPVYVLVALRLRRHAIPAALVLLAVLTVAAGLGHYSVVLLGMFAMGTLMAFGQHRLAQWAARIETLPAGWWLVGGTTVALLTSRALLLDLGPLARFEGAARGLQILGCCALVFMALHCGWLRDALSRPTMHWIGVRSFSLYLVHEPLLVSLAILLPGASVLVLLILTMPLSLALAHVFHRVVERPSQRLAGKAGEWGRALGRTAGEQPARR